LSCTSAAHKMNRLRGRKREACSVCAGAARGRVARGAGA
jgi:hypothetical protein